MVKGWQRWWWCRDDNGGECSSNDNKSNGIVMVEKKCAVNLTVKRTGEIVMVGTVVVIIVIAIVEL